MAADEQEVHTQFLALSPTTSPSSSSTQSISSRFRQSSLSPTRSIDPSLAMIAAELKNLLRKLRPMKKSRASSSSNKECGSALTPSPHCSSAISSCSAPLASSGWLQEDLQRVFCQYDRNGDGKISVEELEAIVCVMGNMMTTNPDDYGSGSKAEAAVMMEVADLNGDGFLDFQEFAACVAPKAHPSSDADCDSCSNEDEDLKLAFAVYDMNGDGVITAEELHTVLRRVMPAGIDDGNAKTLSDCRNMIRAVDSDGDGTVCFKEFVAMMTPAAANCR